MLKGGGLFIKDLRAKLRSPTVSGTYFWSACTHRYIKIFFSIYVDYLREVDGMRLGHYYYQYRCKVFHTNINIPVQTLKRQKTYVSQRIVHI